MRKLFPIIVIFGFLLTVMLFNACVLSKARDLAEKGLFMQARRMARSAMPCDPLLYFGPHSYTRMLTDIEAGEGVRDYLVFHNAGHSPAAGPASFPEDMPAFWQAYQTLIDLTKAGKTAEAQGAFRALMPGSEGPDMLLVPMHTDFKRRFAEMKLVIGGISNTMEQVYATDPQYALKRLAMMLKGFERHFEMRYKPEQPLSIIHGFLYTRICRFHRIAIDGLRSDDTITVERAWEQEMKAVLELIGYMQ